MNTVYIKKGKKYVPIGLETSYLTNGLWLVNGNTKLNLSYYLGKIEKPINAVSHASMLAMSNEITRYVSKLTEEGSAELEEARKYLDIKEPIKIYNISIHDLTTLILNKIVNENNRDFNSETTF